MVSVGFAEKPTFVPTNAAAGAGIACNGTPRYRRILRQRDLATTGARGRPMSLSGPVLTRSRFVRPFAPVAERR
jgi:hypothetical protein